MSKFEDHECLLVRQEEDVVKQFIDTGVFISIRRRFRSWCMISRMHPETSKFFKSNSACRNEEIRHLAHHYNMVHPFSKLKYVNDIRDGKRAIMWYFFFFLVCIGSFICSPCLPSSSCSYQSMRLC